MSILAGTLLQPVSKEQCNVTPSTVVRIGGDGTIAEVGQDQAPSGEIIGGAGCWILPGFIDAHLHVPQWDRRGLEGLSLFEWYDQVAYPAEARLRDAALAERIAEDFVSGVIRAGTTTVAAYGCAFQEATDRMFEVFARRGLRAILGQVLNDTRCPDELQQPTQEGLEQSRTLATKWHGKENGRLSYAFCLRMPVCCSEQLMRGAAALAKLFKCYIQTNVGESLAEVEAVREEFPEQLDDVELFADMGLLTPKTLLGHGVFLDQQERHQVAETRTVLVHCPTANLFLESGLMDYVSHRDAGIRLALGSSIASGPDPFMPRVAVECLQTARALKVHGIPRSTRRVPSAAEAWWDITRGAAESLSMEEQIGTITPGHQADCLVLRPEGWVNELPPEQQVSALLYTIAPHHIEHVFIAGKRVGP